MSDEQKPCCPECGRAEGFDPIGLFRVQCCHCGALLKREEVEPEGEDKR